jgi:hypothetical protein
MSNMSEPIKTPCHTGQLCKVPKYRDQILEDETLDDETRQVALAALAEMCDHETHPDDWFQDPGAGYGTEPFWRSQRARARCFNDCPIRRQCLEIGLQPEHIDHGVWGGYTAAQRKQVLPLWEVARAGQARKAAEAAQREENHDAAEESP